MQEIFSNEQLVVTAQLGDEQKVKDGDFHMISHTGRIVEKMLATDKQSGVEIDMTALVAENYRIVLNEYTSGVEPDTKLIAMNFLDHMIKQRSKLLALLHEIGHTHVFAKLESAGKTHKDLPLYAHERGAWAYALKIYREFKSKGFEIAGGMTPSEVRSMIRGFLLRYEVITGNHTRVVKGESGLKFCLNPKAEDIDLLISEGLLRNFPQTRAFREFLANRKR